MKFPLGSTFCIILISLPLLLAGQKQLSNDMLGTSSRVCLEIADEQELTQAYQDGMTAFIPSNGSQTKLVNIFEKLAQLKDQKSDSGCILINLYHNAREWENAVNKAGLSKWIVSPAKYNKNDLFYYQLSANDILSFSKSESTSSFLNYGLLINFETDSLTNQKLKNDFLLANAKASKTIINDTSINRDWLNRYEDNLHSSLIYLSDIWITTGKRPHFIHCTMADIQLAKELCVILNSTSFYSVRFNKNKELFTPVRNKENPNFLGGGRGSIPVINNNPLQLTPMSKGYRFSPDIFRFTNEHKWQEVVINSFPLAINYKQISHFHFDDSQIPATPIIDNIFSTSESLLLENEQRGKVFAFNGTSDYIDCGSTLQIDFSSPITISAWIKPEENRQNHSIVGMGNSFSMKIQRKQLTFTRADISDTRFPGNEIKLNEWQHVAIVFEPNEQISLYQNGQLIGSTEATEILESQHSILIGSNLWGEYYKGLMDDLQIWNRALSSDEIKRLSQSQSEINNGWIKQMVIAIITSLFIIALLIVYRRSKKSVDQESKSRLDEPSAKPVQNIETIKPVSTQHQSSILTFGEFRIFTAEGNNLVPQLSPKEKQLLLYLLWHSIRNKKEGVTSRQMSEDLWPNMSADKAKNNRSTYMQRLRKQLTESTGIQINYASNKKWCLVIPDQYHCDLLIYNDALQNLQSDRNVDNLKKILDSLSDGSFLPETHNDVTDVFKSEIENEIIITLTKPEIISMAQDQVNILPLLTATIRKYDPLNETALSLEINWFHKMGHHGRTLETYQRFCREYELLFGEKFNTEMEELIN